jgi:hypothetical protein
VNGGNVPWSGLPIDRIDVFDKTAFGLPVERKCSVTAFLGIPVKVQNAKVAERATTVGIWF